MDALDQRVAGSNPKRVAVFAFLGKMLNLDCLSQPRGINGYLFGHVCKAARRLMADQYSHA